jgi:putative DNA methylase
VWEATHHLIRALNTEGEIAAGALLAAMPDKAEPIRQLAYHLYTLCERKKWAEDARAYNELITAWHAVLRPRASRARAGSSWGLRCENVGALKGNPSPWPRPTCSRPMT